MGMGAAATKTTTKKVNGKKAKAAAKPKRKATNYIYMHIIIEFLADGTGAVERMIKRDNIKPHIVRRAAKELLETHPDKADLFVAWVVKHYPVGGRGKTAPVIGDTRDYTAQQLKPKKVKGKLDKINPVFIRLPLDSLGIKKKEIARTEFHDDRIVVYKR